MIDLASAVYEAWASQFRPPTEPGGTAGRSPPCFLAFARKQEGGASLKRRPRSSLAIARDTMAAASDACLSRSARGGRRLTIRDLPVGDRPRERLAALGPHALSAVELIACLLGRGTSGEPVLTIAQRLLAKFGSLEGVAEASVEELQQVRGLGLAKACQIQAAWELGRRAEAEPENPRGRPIETVQAAGQAARRFLAGRKKEHFILILLDSRHRVLKTAEISVGSLDMSIVHPRETFREAIVARASAIILAHNHPSGDSTPSREDLELTRRLTEAGRLLGIPVLDHLIVGNGEPLSLRAAGFLE